MPEINLRTLSMPKRGLFLALAILLTFSSPSCSPANPAGNPRLDGGPQATQAPLPTQPVSSPIPTSPIPSTHTLEATGQPAVQPPEPSPLELPKYTLSAALDYSRHHLAVEESIRYTNRSAEAIPDLLLVVQPVYYPGVFELGRLNWENGQPVEGFAWDGAQLHLPLAQPLAPGESLGLDLSYELNLPAPVPSPTTRPEPFGYTPRQTNLVDWYPFIPPYIPGQGWLVHSTGFFGEHQVYEVADFEVSIRLLDERDDLTIAASAPAELEGDMHRYRLDSARNFAWSVSHIYQVLTETAGDVTITGYAFPYHAAAGELALKTAAQALALFSEKFAPYPYASLSVVEADFLDGMEYAGIFFLSNGFYNVSQGKPDEYLTAIAAHETAHQWWYGLVGNDQALEPWLDEALSTYSERIFYEGLFPQALDWWWAYRVNYYEPLGPVDGSIYNPGGFRPYRDAVYLNGALFLEELRTLAGDEAFFAFLKDYASQYAQKIATREDFFSLLKNHTQADIGPLLQKYFANP
jgi:hypothetical protein